MFLIAKNIEFNKELSKYLYKELKDSGINVTKDGVIINAYLKNKDLLIDCMAGKVFIKDDVKDKYLCDLGCFKNKTHLGEAYNCAIFNCKKLIKKIENLNNDEMIKESEVEIKDLRSKPLDLRIKKNLKRTSEKHSSNIMNSILLFINNTFYEGRSIIAAIKKSFNNKYNNNVYDARELKKIAGAYKDKRNIYINNKSFKNLTYDEFYDILKDRYPQFNIYGNFENNRIINRIAKKNYPDSAYDWVKERAELLIEKEDMNPNMAYGIAWIQYKDEFE